MSIGVREQRGPTVARRRRPRVALVGADGAGKSTLTAMLEAGALPVPVKRIYMGVNLEASSLMLPTTRLLLAVKRARGGRPDMTAGALRGPEPTVPSRGNLRRTARDAARLTVWTLEEWLRQLVAATYSRRGYLVVFDRHFYADYYHSDVASGSSVLAGIHGWMLEHAYPKPDLVVCLDAPADVLFQRKPEATLEWLEHRRQEYLALSEVVPRFVVVDVDRPLPHVLSDVLGAIRTQLEEVSA